MVAPLQTPWKQDLNWMNIRFSGDICQEVFEVFLCTFNLRPETKKESVQFRMVQIKLLRKRLQNNSLDYIVKGYYSFKANFLSLSLRVTKWKWWETQIHVSGISENARRVLSNLWFKERVLQEVQHASMQQYYFTVLSFKKNATKILMLLVKSVIEMLFRDTKLILIIGYFTI